MIRPFFPRLVKGSVWTSILMLAGCAAYHPQPLPVAPDLASRPSLTVPASEFWLPGLKPRAFPANGLNETSVVTLAVFDNPDLKAARLQAGVAGAQMLAAGLLPDPVINVDFARSALNYGGDIGLTEDLQALRTRGPKQAAARAHEQQVHLQILWQEWQVAEKAQELFIQARADAQLERALKANNNLLACRYREDEAALRKSDVTLSATTAGLMLLTQTETNLRKVQLDSNLTNHALNQLLGLKPQVQLRLVGPPIRLPLSRQQFQAAVIGLPRRRADLLALKAGYQAQEETVRQAILKQFPALSAGVIFSRDPVEGVNEVGPSISLTLPLFNRNRGQIAVQRATRALLRQTYQARLDQAVSDADQIWKANGIMQNQLLNLEARLALLRKAASAARRSFQQKDLSTGIYVNAESNLSNRRAEAIRLRASLERGEAALQTVLGLPFGAP